MHFMCGQLVKKIHEFQSRRIIEIRFVMVYKGQFGLHVFLLYMARRQLSVISVEVKSSYL